MKRQRVENKMGLADKLKTVDQIKSGLPCGIGTLLEKLPKADREALQEVMLQAHGPARISNRQIHEVLLGEGHEIAFHSVSAHRRKQCRCFLMSGVPTKSETASA